MFSARSDGYDAAVPYIPHLTWGTEYTTPLFVALVLSFVPLVLALPLVPLRPVFLVGGLAPFVATHPVTQRYVGVLEHTFGGPVRMSVQRAADDLRLDEKHWTGRSAERPGEVEYGAMVLRSVCVWENERWTSGGGWSSGNLKMGERAGWTRREDGQEAVASDER